jgi:hypothetical protein
VVDEPASDLHSLKEQGVRVGSGGGGGRCDEGEGVDLVPKNVHFVERSAAGIELSPHQNVALVETAGMKLELCDRDRNRLLPGGPISTQGENGG